MQEKQFDSAEVNFSGVIRELLGPCFGIAGYLLIASCVATSMTACTPRQSSNSSRVVWTAPEKSDAPATGTVENTPSTTKEAESHPKPHGPNPFVGGATSKKDAAEKVVADSKELAQSGGDSSANELRRVPEKERRQSSSETAHKEALAAKVLDPKRFRTEHWQDKPMVPVSYEIAKKRPDVLERLFCYCGCDLTEHHKTLLDCFTDTDEHGSTCSECIDEAFLADRLYKDGATMARIQQMVDEEFCPKYPFAPSERTATYRSYLARRLYTNSTEPSCGENYRKE